MHLYLYFCEFLYSLLETNPLPHTFDNNSILGVECFTYIAENSSLVPKWGNHSSSMIKQKCLCPPELVVRGRHTRSLWRYCFCCCSAESCLTVFDPMDCSTPGFPVLHYFLEFAQTRIHWVDDAIQPSHPLLTPSPAFSLFQHQSLFQWIGSSHQEAKLLELQFQHQSFQWIFRVDFL